VGERIAIHAKQAVKDQNIRIHKQASILYESKCDKCNPDKTGNSSLQEGDHHLEGMEESRKEERRVEIYIGDLSRSLYERSKEHMSDAEGFQEGSHIVKHWTNNMQRMM
jgi:hypothetical protein